MVMRGHFCPNMVIFQICYENVQRHQFYHTTDVGNKSDNDIYCNICHYILYRLYVKIGNKTFFSQKHGFITMSNTLCGKVYLSSHNCLKKNPHSCLKHA